MKERVIYLDALRVLSCFMIVCMHSPMPTGGIGIFNAGLSYITAPGLVMFFMISGALLLPVKTDTKTFLKRRLSKVVLPTIVFTLIYLVIKHLHGESFGWTIALLSMPFSTQGHGVLWFMYTLIGLYLLAPILSHWLKFVSKRELQAYLLLWGLTLCLPIFKQFLTVNSTETSSLYYFSGYAGYFVLGHYLKRYGAEMKLLPWIVLSIFALLAYPLSKICLGDVELNGVFWYLSVTVAVMAITLYLIVFNLFKSEDGGGKILGSITTASNLSFGIYLVHIIVMRDFIWKLDFISEISNYILQTFVIIILTYMVSFTLVYVISLIPGAEYIIGYRRRLR